MGAGDEANVAPEEDLRSAGGWGFPTGIRCCFAVVHVCPYSFVCSELCGSWKTNSVIYNDINIYIYITWFLYARHMIWIDVTYLPNCFFFPVRFGLSDQAYLPWNGTYSKIPHPQRCCFRAYDRLLALASEKWWIFQWEFQDPKLEVPIPYIRPIFEA